MQQWSKYASGLLNLKLHDRRTPRLPQAFSTEGPLNPRRYVKPYLATAPSTQGLDTMQRRSRMKLDFQIHIV